MSCAESLLTTVIYQRSLQYIVFAFHPIPFTGGSFSGWHGADANCHQTALHRLGIPRFKAFLVDKNFPVERLVKWQYQNIPVINLESQIIFPKWRDFLYGVRSNVNVPFYDLNGMPDVQSSANRSFWLGGGVNFGCDDWTSSSPMKYGLVWSFDYLTGEIKISYAKCNSYNYLMCYKLLRLPVVAL
ncbi:unnamed protein product [Trichobilharzia regenti]|nr:unnamed protein product [Trichobilharzia regenti]